ncbi:hypothetical protein MLD38_018007 [Melastoma candidum]|uniref:Uncharacterized protein n=1 Tax=Melastoma candidum TaxID=119954 RepID=A0ACB9QRX1_9MYRT|nr:hypothetical protein MLD38_018007 [Melastoma candidum]
MFGNFLSSCITGQKLISKHVIMAKVRNNRNKRTDEGKNRPSSFSGSFSSAASSSFTFTSIFSGFSFSSSFAASLFFSSAASWAPTLMSAPPSRPFSSGGTAALSSTFLGSSMGAAPVAAGFLLGAVVFPVATPLFDSLQPMIFLCGGWECAGRRK